MMNTTDKILIILGTFFVLFVAAVLWVFVRVGAEPTVLVGATAGALIAEILILFRIKTGKQRQDEAGRDEDIAG